MLIPGFSNLNFAALLEPFRLANLVGGRSLYEWTLLSTDGSPVSTSSLIPIPVQGSIYDPVEVDDLFVISGYRVEDHCNHSLFGRLRKIARFGCRIGGFGTGAVVLAKAGLLDGYRATVHWEVMDEISDRFPNIELVSDRYVIDRGRYTSGGAGASLDFALELIGASHGKGFALGLGSRFIYSQYHPSTEPQMLLDTGDIGWRDPLVGSAIVLMKRHAAPCISTFEIAELLGIRVRTLQRRFLKALSVSPGEFYRDIRLDFGRKLILYGRRSVEEVAATTGFGSGSAFARAFRHHYGIAPSALRRSALRDPNDLASDGSQSDRRFKQNVEE